MIGSINLKDLRCQIGKDLKGKDSYRGVTFTYTWIANQFGHFSLGFIPTLLFFYFLKWISTVFKCISITHPALWAVVTVSCAWLLFETYNFLDSFFKIELSWQKLRFVRRQHVFPLPLKNVIFDTITDLCFFWSGSFAASLLLEFFPTMFYILVLLIPILFCLTRHWLVTKMYIQFARLPTQLRLSQWTKNISHRDKITVWNYLKSALASHDNHLLIFGGRRTGKSLLAIGIATELSIEKHSCSYYTGMKLYNLFSLTDREIIKTEDCEKWSWRRASLLVVDDVNPGGPIPRNFITPDILEDLIDTPIPGNSNENNKKDLISKNVIWVLGDYGNDWIPMFHRIGVQKITSVNLSFND